jgi:hypothetical protein
MNRYLANERQVKNTSYIIKNAITSAVQLHFAILQTIGRLSPHQPEKELFLLHISKTTEIAANAKGFISLKGKKAKMHVGTSCVSFVEEDERIFRFRGQGLCDCSC